ncbi:hypothetical protein MED134_05459 [Dokdonia sp. MED134]|uniref:hypothetical protein n=1 Tax=Dokdonia sp. MED134 TaxID=313590 RepID=UPI000068AC23|nr:hypothetical protein [Dokdonia sp. MED134]EAQ40175.1 hypothetical protein MED134_05459 [Dokdonia sp. MED134]
MKIYITLVLTFIIATTTIAQEDKESKREKIKALKVAFITERLELTPDEAQTFWPVYNIYDGRVNDIYDTERKVMRELRTDFDTMDEAAATKTLQTIQSLEKQKLDARAELLSGLKDKITSKKTLVLFKAENDFRRDLIRKLRGDKGRNRGNR